MLFLSNTFFITIETGSLPLRFPHHRPSSRGYPEQACRYLVNIFLSSFASEKMTLLHKHCACVAQNTPFSAHPRDVHPIRKIIA